MFMQEQLHVTCESMSSSSSPCGKWCKCHGETFLRIAFLLQFGDMKTSSCSYSRSMWGLGGNFIRSRLPRALISSFRASFASTVHAVSALNSAYARLCFGCRGVTSSTPRYEITCQCCASDVLRSCTLPQRGF